jgi:branched-chain amino acid transport system permease protein
MNAVAGQPRAMIAAVAAATLLWLALPLLVDRGLLFLAGIVAIDIVIALAFNLLFRTAGLLSFGQAAFIAIGGYGVGYGLTAWPGVPFPALWLGSGLAGALAAIGIGLIAQGRIAGIAFAVLTLALGELLRVAITETTALGRNDGLANIPRPVLHLGLRDVDLAQGNRFYVLIVLACAGLVVALWWLTFSPVGRMLRAQRMEPARAAFLGIDTRTCRLGAFAISGGVTALAGGLLAPWAGIVTPDLAHWSTSTAPLLNTLLGGAGNFWGPAVGAILFAALNYSTRSLEGFGDLITGGLLLAVVLILPGGIISLWQRRR